MATARTAEPGAPSPDNAERVYEEFAKQFEARYGDMKPIVAKLSKLADDGYAEAQYYLGMHYNNGIGVPRDPRQAYVWFSKAAAGGEPLAAYKVGCYLNGQFDVVPPDPAKALESKLIAARAGYVLAQRDVADRLYEEGKAAESFKWRKAAADQGDPQSLFLLAGAYDTWSEVKDPVLAYAYMRLAKDAMGDRFSAGMEGLLARLKGNLSASDRAKAEGHASQWMARPTPLTSKAQFGWDAEVRFLKAAPEAKSAN